MPNLDNLNVSIEANLETQQAQKEIDSLEQRMNDLERPRRVELDATLNLDQVISAIEKKMVELNRQITELFNNGGDYRNQYRQFNQLAELKYNLENGAQMTAGELQQVLEGMGFKLDNDTISAISFDQSTGFSELKDAALTMHQMVAEYNQLLASTRNQKDPLSEKDLAKTYAKLDELKQVILDKGVDQKAFNSNGYINYQKAWESIETQRQQQEPQRGQSDMSKIAAGLLGIRTLYTLVRRIAATNEKLSAAVNNIINTLGAILEPILSFLAALINTFASWLGRLFGVSKATGKTVKSIGASVKQLAGFDEINNIGGSSGGGGAGGGGANPGNLQWFDDILSGLVEMIRGIIQVIANTITLAFVAPIAAVWVLVDALAGLAGALAGAAAGLVSGILGAVSTLLQNLIRTITSFFSDVWRTVTSFFTGFIEGFRKAREEGSGIIGAIFSGIWTALTSFVSNLWTTIKNLFTNIWNTIKSTVNKFITNFKTAWTGVTTWVKEKVMKPIETNITNLYNKTIKPILDGIVNGWNTIKSGFSKLISGIKGMINNVIRVINKIPGVNIPLLASGGMVPNGQLFIANENGPELVGTMNGTTTVANNSQIIEGIKQGVLEAMSQVSTGGGDQNINLFIDGRQVADVVVQNIKRQTRVLGGSVL